VHEALARLAPVLAEIPYGVGAHLARLTGAMAGSATDAGIVLPVLARRATDAMERAARFAVAYRSVVGDLPEAGDPGQIQSVIARFTNHAAELGMSEREAYGLAEAWFTADEWVQPVLYLAERKEVRTALPERERLTVAAEAVGVDRREQPVSPFTSSATAAPRKHRRHRHWPGRPPESGPH